MLLLDNAFGSSEVRRDGDGEVVEEGGEGRGGGRGRKNLQRVELMVRVSREGRARERGSRGREVDEGGVVGEEEEGGGGDGGGSGEGSGVVKVKEWRDGKKAWKVGRDLVCGNARARAMEDGRTRVSSSERTNERDEQSEEKSVKMRFKTTHQQILHLSSLLPHSLNPPNLQNLQS